MKFDFVTMNARFLPSTILNGIKYVKCYSKMDEETIFTVCMFFKVAVYSCFSVVLAGSFHFFKEKYLFILLILFICFRINYYYF